MCKMYCVNCGAKLGSGEKICPLCDTKVYHPDINIDEDVRLYPSGRMPEVKRRSNAFNGALIIIFLIPAIVSFIADFQFDGQIRWSDYVFGALILSYITFALPLWFEKPNPVVFTPCVFASVAVYLLYINFSLGGNWFLSFAFPVSAGLGIIATAVVALLYYLKKGKLYIWGGAFVTIGTFVMLIEYFMAVTFNTGFMGWSLYPFVVLGLLGGLLLYLAINKSAREIMERKLFF